MRIGKKKVKLSLCVDDMIRHLDNIKESIGQLLQGLREFSKVASYKINIRKSIYKYKPVKRLRRERRCYFGNKSWKKISNHKFKKTCPKSIGVITLGWI